MINPELLDTILLEWSYRLKDGIPDVNDPEKVRVLNQVLAENKMPLYEVGRDTELASEGLIIYFSTLDDSNFNSALEFVYNSDKNKKDKRPVALPIKDSNVDPQYYGQATGPVIEAIKQYNSNNIDYHLFKNALSSANTIRKHMGKLSPDRIDRGTLYTKIRNQATTLAKKAGLTGIVDDKWCPADIMVYGPNVDSSLINSINILNAESKKEKSINGLFIDKFEIPESGKILGISLKQAEARGGKAKSFTSILTRENDYPDISKLDDKYAFYMELSVFLNAVIDPGNDEERLKRKSTSALKEIAKNKTVLSSLPPAVKNELDSLTKKLSTYKVKKSDVDALYKVIYKDCEKEYKDIRDGFITILNKEKYEVTQTKTGTVTDIETFLKKASCYLVASDLIMGFDGGLFKLPDAIKSISIATNPFVALTAYAIGYAGVSPSFFKLKGNESSKDAVFKLYEGDGVLVLPETSKVKIQDNPAFKGFVAMFICDAEVNGVKKHSYSIELSFKYSEITISVEVVDIKES